MRVLLVSVIIPSRAFCRFRCGKLIAVLSHRLNLFHIILVTGHRTKRGMRVSSFTKTAQWCFYLTHFAKLLFKYRISHKKVHTFNEPEKRDHCIDFKNLTVKI